MANGWEVAEPVVGEAYDLVAKNPETDVWVRIQVKTVRERDDRGGALVVDAKKNNGRIYDENDCEYFIGVHQRAEGHDDVYLIANRRLSEYWKPEGTPRPGYEWRLLNSKGSD